MQRTILMIIVAAMASILPIKSTAETPASERGSFAWGAEVGPGIDMGGDDMSTLNVHARIGYRKGWIKFVGLGAGIDVMMSNSSRSVPVYAIIQSSFSSKPKLLFGEIKVGCAYNQTPGVADGTSFYLSPGLGITLARGNRFSSHLVLSYAYNSMTFLGDREDTLVKGLNRVNIGIGVTF